MDFPTINRQDKLNIIITIAKQVILKARHGKYLPNKQQFHSLLKVEAEKEYASAVKQQSIKNFELKWGTVAKIISEAEP